MSTQLCLPTWSVLVWPKSLFDTYICVWYIYILPLFVYPTLLAKTGSVIVWTKSRARYVYISVDVVSKYICLLNSACRQRVCLGGQSRHWYAYMCLIHVYILPLFVYKTPLAKTGSVIVWTKLRVQCMYMYLWMLLLPYIHIVDVWYIFMCLIYIWILSQFMSVGTNGLEMWIWTNVTSVGMAGTASRRDKRKTRVS